ncbi:hypothetical protein C8P68_1105 [Mucilaginibacter yixingensis]|uniref:Uncharacterized protein n=2 Tax=Mucilaginibacter yixingensis TaxID=1295612 RepID=A0A2T5J4X2_9SPHI|nr:hypothetical protein C8P68_1105 [Mucilaginibacter yixingensis]
MGAGVCNRINHLSAKAMKIITSSVPWDISQIFITLQQQLNPLFKEHRGKDLQFKIEREGNKVLVSKPEMYDGYLFTIEAMGKELHIGKSEHYVDDVNQITLQSIIETLQMEIQGGNDIIYISGE